MFLAFSKESIKHVRFEKNKDQIIMMITVW